MRSSGADATELSRTIASTATIRLANLPTADLFYTPLEERFERITRLARRALDVPVAAISVMSPKKQWFKSVSGWSVTELPLERSFCQLTLETRGANVISDTQADPRTRNHPLVVGPPRFRFYAGFTLTDSNDLAVGTFCVFDVKPRALTSAEHQCLLDLAALAQRELVDDHLRNAHAALTAKLSIARRESMMDPLTRLWNRRGALMLLESAFRNADRAGIRLGVALIDLDDFKHVNDTHGHQVGDEVLRRIGGRLVRCVRHDDAMCRIGGDEFLLLMVDADATTASAVAERVRSEVTDQPIATRSGTITMTASVGCTIREPGETTSIEDLLDRADRALLKSKGEGRNRVRMLNA
ncbi:MAG: sensor domain-containing diguanylate cyclase [Gammaproteobacteria bacterium]|nr:sensor domain-containing diguanylate cyclase [Gammaproteobacteria bacterium]